MIKRVKVCCFCEKWASGGIESFINNVINRIDLNEIRIDIIASSIENSIFTTFLKKKGIRFFELSGNLHNLRKNYKMFYEKVLEEKYDVIHFHCYQAMSLYYVHIAKHLGVMQRIVHSHNTDLRNSKSRWVKMLVHKLYSNMYTKDATQLWACSEDAATFLFSPSVIKERGYTFIPNGIELKKFQYNPEERIKMRKALSIEKKFVIGNVGRLCYQKNQDFLLNVFYEICKVKEDCVLLLVGEGEDEKYLKEKAVKLGIDGGVIFYGTSNEVNKLFCAMDVFAFPSRFEGLGIVAIEAQTSGIPVICSELIPKEALVTKFASILSLKDGEKNWAKKILSVESMEREQLICSSLAMFDIEEVTKIIEMQYKENTNE